MQPPSVTICLSDYPVLWTALPYYITALLLISLHLQTVAAFLEIWEAIPTLSPKPNWTYGGLKKLRKVTQIWNLPHPC